MQNRREENFELEMREVGETNVTIRGQEVSLTVSEGNNRDGDPYRSMVGMFDGADGQVLLTISGRTSNWDQAAIDAFLASIH
jgi:hypothetical protein